MARIGLKLREQVKQHGVDVAYKLLREGIEQRKVVVKRDFSLREAAESMVGPNWAHALKQYADVARVVGPERAPLALRESAEAVDASNFAAITGQLLVDTVREKYQFAQAVTDEMFTTLPISNGNLGTQREPWLSYVQNDPDPINQLMPYPTTQFIGQYVDYPAPEKYGQICHVSFEMIFSDLTSQAVESAESVGDLTGLWVEYKRLAVALGLVNNHSWNGTTYNTYLTSGAWVNKLTSFTLTDWRSMNTIEQLFVQMMDPVTGKPIRIEPKDVFVMPTLKYLAKRILNATEVREGNITSGAGTQTLADNPLDRNYRVLTSPHARNLVLNGYGNPAKGGIAASGYTTGATDSVVLVGDFKRAFVWRQVYAPKFTQAPPQNYNEFNNDIVLSVKSSVYGVAGVRDPRFAVYAYNSAA